MILSTTRRIGFVLLLAGCISPVSTVWANKAAPPPRPEGAPLEVVRQKDAGSMRLEIPRDLLPKDVKGAGAFGSLDGGHTIVAGLCLSLAVVVGGFWLVRRFGLAGRDPLPRAATATLFALVALFGAAFAWANVPPPALKAKLAKAADLRLNVVVVERGDKLVLRASDAELEKLLIAAELSDEANDGPEPKAVPPGTPER